MQHSLQPIIPSRSSAIHVEGARVHNLRNVTLDIPRNQLVVLTGLSGSGKSSLAIDTIFAEGQRQYIESLAVGSRLFLQQWERPDVDQLLGLPPTISVDQRRGSHNPRSTVATITEVYDYLRLLYARVGQPHCFQCNRPIRPQSPAQIIEEILVLPENSRCMILAPVIRGKRGEHKDVFRRIIKSGFVRVRIDGALLDVEQVSELNPNQRHDIEVVVDRLVLKNGIRPRLSESLKLALQYGEGVVVCVYEKERIVNPDGTTKSVWKDVLFSTLHSCPKCKISYAEIEPRTFSFNSPYGACPSCFGLGVREEFDSERVFPDPILSLKNGAIAPWALLSSSTQRLIQSHLDKFWAKLESAEKSSEKTAGQMVGKTDDKTDEKTDRETSEKPFEGEIGVGPNVCEPEKNGRKTENKGKKSVSPFEKYEKNPICQFDDSVHDALYFGEKAETAQSTDSTAYLFPGIIPLLNEIYEKIKHKKEKDLLKPFRATVSCPECGGSRLRAEARSVTIGQQRIFELCSQTIANALSFCRDLEFSNVQKTIAEPILQQVVQRLDFMNRIGLGYLTLDRSAKTLSGGELQRVRLATGLGSGLVGVCYILDEPSIGLHPRDNQRLIDAIRLLQRQGNSVLVVEHDEAIIREADWLIDMGPGAGHLGGQVIAQGTPESVQNNAESMTGRYLSGKEQIPVPKVRRKWVKSKSIILEGVTTNNLKNVTVQFPLGIFVCVTGVSGSGKSSLLNETLVPAVMRRLTGEGPIPGPHKSLRGTARIDKLVRIDQSPIGRSPRSNPATTIGVFDEIRKVFASTKDAKRFGFKSGRFSFNIVGGRCEECQGQGVQKIEMHFLPDIFATCPLCNGKRFNRQTLSILYKGKSIADVLDMQIDEASNFFGNYPGIVRLLESLKRVGLGYLTLGQSSTTLSGGEAQRVKLAAELARVETGNTLYVLDEPTSGLHIHDVKQLLDVLSTLVDHGNTVLVIEHNVDVMKTADWIIDFGPEGGERGGEIVAKGTPEEIAVIADNYTGQVLKRYLYAM